MWARRAGDGVGAVVRARDNDRAHAGIPERRVDMWEALHATFCREAKEAGTQGRPRCRTLFLGDSITEACRGTQFGEYYDELAARRRAFEDFFPLKEARAFGISGDRTQNLLYRVCNGELSFRHPPSVVVLCIGTNNLGRDNDSAEDTFLGIRAVVLEILQRLPGTRVLLTGILPRGPAAGSPPQMPPVPFESDAYVGQQPLNPNPNPREAFARKYAQPGVHTPAIHAVNERLKALASGSGGSVAYVECGFAFLTADGGAIRPELMRDVLPPSAAGMRAWFAVLKPAVDALRNAPAPRDSWYEGPRAIGDGGDAANGGERSTNTATNTMVANDGREPGAHNGSLNSVSPGVRLALSRLIAWSPHALCVADATAKDQPIVFANDNFFVQTGYPPEEVLGRNCRFLQGPGTDRDTIRAMREAIARGKEFHGRLMNYHKNGTSLVNSLVMSPLRDEKGIVTHFIGIQRLAPAKSLDDAPAEYQFRAAL